MSVTRVHVVMAEGAVMASRLICVNVVMNSLAETVRGVSTKNIIIKVKT